MKLFEPFQPLIWTSSQPFRFYGLQLGVRMTIIDLSGQGDLLVHSPIKLNPELCEAFLQLGTVRYVVAPNRWHHLYVTDFQSQFPNAHVLCCPGLDTKRADVNFDDVISNDHNYPWSSELQHHVLEGCPMLNEVVFFHPQSRTLIVTDLGLHICDDSPFVTRLLFKAMGNFKRFGWATLEKKIFIKDKCLFSQSIAAVLDWDFEHIVLSHGRLIRGNGKKVFQKAFAENPEH